MNAGPTIGAGSGGGAVRRLQRILAMTKILGPDQINGLYTVATTGAVTAFQDSAGLQTDGICGPATWAALPADPGTATLRDGDAGAVVTALQNGLTRYGDGADPGGVDGFFGPKTTAGVLEYQRQHGVPADGIVGDVTWWVPAGGAGATLASLSELTTV